MEEENVKLFCTAPWGTEAIVEEEVMTAAPQARLHAVPAMEWPRHEMSEAALDTQLANSVRLSQGLLGIVR